jgi:type I restriction enzyme, R subunit
VVLFINGLPLAMIELKNAGDEQATLHAAFNQLQTYKAQIPSLFRTNAVLVTSDGLSARLGSLTANAERFMPWRTTDGRDLAGPGTPELPMLVAGVFERRRFLDLVQAFIVFKATDRGLVKVRAITSSTPCGGPSRRPCAPWRCRTRPSPRTRKTTGCRA